MTCYGNIHRSLHLQQLTLYLGATLQPRQNIHNSLAGIQPYLKMLSVVKEHAAFRPLRQFRHLFQFSLCENEKLLVKCCHWVGAVFGIHV